MTTKTIKYEPGDVFACELPRGGWGVFVVARWAELPTLSRKQVMIYGINRIWEQLPESVEVARLRPTDGCMFSFANAGPLKKGVFPRIGRIEGFNKEEWPVPIRRTWGEATGDPLQVSNIEVWAGGFIDSAGYLEDRSELEYLPFRGGLSYVEATPERLDEAIRDHDPFLFFPVSKRAIDIWMRIYAKLEREGKLKEFASDGWYSGGIDRTRSGYKGG